MSTKSRNLGRAVATNNFLRYVYLTIQAIDTKKKKNRGGADLLGCTRLTKTINYPIFMTYEKFHDRADEVYSLFRRFDFVRYISVGFETSS